MDAGHSHHQDGAPSAMDTGHSPDQDGAPSAVDATSQKDASAETSAESGSACVVAASGYDRTCATSSDCVGVPVGGDTCAGLPSGYAHCALAAVNARVAAQYQADLEAALISHGTDRTEGCPTGIDVACVAGTCTTSFLSSLDAGTGTSGSAAEAGADAAPECGAVASDGGTLILIASGGGAGAVTAEATFPEPGVGPQDTCATPVDAGACSLTACQMGGIGSPAWGYGNFGPISVTVGSTTVPLTYAQAGYPTIGFPSPVSLGTGGTMTFRGGGACGVPAFDITATIPGHAVLASPAPTADGGAPVIDTSQDLSVTWPAISIGQAHFDLSGGSWQIGDTAITVRCTFDGSAGSGTVSHTLLSSLKTMAGTTPVYADMWSDLEVTTVVSGLTITTQSGPGSTAADRAFNVTLQ